MTRDNRAVTDTGGRKADANRDPISGEPGAHPVGTGVGAAAAGAAAGAAGGLIAGPAGAAVGAVIGAVAGGLAGKGVAESIDPTVEDTYWRENYTQRPYYDKNTAYEDYRPAYQLGWESRSKYASRSFDEAEPELGRDWESAKRHSQLTWEKAKHATRDAWDRIEHSVAGKPERQSLDEPAALRPKIDDWPRFRAESRTDASAFLDFFASENTIGFTEHPSATTGVLFDARLNPNQPDGRRCNDAQSAHVLGFQHHARGQHAFPGCRLWGRAGRRCRPADWHSNRPGRGLGCGQQSGSRELFPWRTS